ncbi:MAG: hypothetical protein ACI9KE_003022, partial [Polyangiales bacterium]
MPRPHGFYPLTWMIVLEVAFDFDEGRAGTFESKR